MITFDWEWFKWYVYDKDGTLSLETEVHITINWCLEFIKNKFKVNRIDQVGTNDYDIFDFTFKR